MEDPVGSPKFLQSVYVVNLVRTVDEVRKVIVGSVRSIIQKGGTYLGGGRISK